MSWLRLTLAALADAVDWPGRPVDQRGKRPKGGDWADRARLNPPEETIAATELIALNTGTLCDGLIAVDVDVDDAAPVSQIVAAAYHHMGSAPLRTRLNSASVGNTLGPTLRDARDGKQISFRARRNWDVCREPHVTLVGNITKDELMNLISNNDKSNGFSNRFL